MYGILYKLSSHFLSSINSLIKFMPSELIFYPEFKFYLDENLISNSTSILISFHNKFLLNILRI